MSVGAIAGWLVALGVVVLWAWLDAARADALGEYPMDLDTLPATEPTRLRDEPRS